MFLRRITTDQDDHSAVAGEKLNKKKELNLGKWLEVQPFRAIHGVVHVMRGTYGITSLIKALPWPYYHFCIKTLYRTGFLKQGSIQSEEWKDAANVQKMFIYVKRNGAML